MKLIDTIQTAQSNLSRAKARTFLTILAVFIGTFTLAMTTALTSGIKQYVDVQIHAYGETNSMRIQSKEDGGVLTQQDIINIHDVKNMTGVYGSFNIVVNALSYGDKQIQQPAVTALYPGMNPSLAVGSVPDVKNTSGIILPYTALSALGLSNPSDILGKQLTLHIITLGSAVNSSKDVRVTVQGVLANSIHGQPTFLSYMLIENLYAFQHGATSTATFKVIYATSTPLISTNEMSILKSTLDEKGYRVLTFQDQISNLNQAITLVQLGLGAFAGISLLVACIGIINTLLMSVLERMQEIGLLKALGMKRRDIFSIFTFEAISIGFWGGLLGVGIAMLLGPVLNRIVEHIITNLQGFSLLTFPIISMVYIVIGAMIIGFLAGVIPAIRASRLDPIVALRRE